MGQGDATTKGETPFKDLSASELRSLANRTVVIVAGTYVAEVAQAVGLTKLTCPVLSSSALDLSKTSDSAGTQFSCDIEGSNLGGATRVRLRNAKQSSDQVTADAIITPSLGSTTAGKAVFTAADLRSFAASQYAVYLVLTNGQETSTGLTVTLAPAIDSATVKLSSCSAATKCQIQLTGYNLTLLDTTVTLTSDGAAVKDAVLATGSPLGALRLLCEIQPLLLPPPPSSY